MANLILNTQKPGETTKKLVLNTQKGQKYRVELSWDGNVDIDLHAFMCVNNGGGAKLSSFDDVLSTYNVVRKIPSGETVGTLNPNTDGTFSIWNEALVHSKDSTTGITEGVDEWVSVDVSKIPPLSVGVYEIPLLAMIHPQSAGNTFSKVQNATVRILDASGKELINASLSNQFGQFVGVQMGTIMIDQGVASYVNQTSGFTEDINEVLSFFS